MRWDVWLAEPNTGRSLHTAVRGAGLLCVVWAVAVTYGLWSARSSLASEQRDLASRRTKLTEVATGLRTQRASARLADRLDLSAPEGAATAAFADQVGRAAHAAGVEMAGLRIAPVVQSGSAQKQAGGAPAQPPADAPARANAASSGGQEPAQQAPSTPAADGDDGWRKGVADVSVAGTFSQIVGFLRSFVAMPRVLEFSGLELNRVGLSGARGSPVIQLRLTLTLYGVQAKP